VWVVKGLIFEACKKLVIGGDGLVVVGGWAADDFEFLAGWKGLA
jgi:hypothetical protein